MAPTWRDLGPTPGQYNLLIKLGLTIADLNRGEASDLISHELELQKQARSLEGYFQDNGDEEVLDRADFPGSSPFGGWDDDEY